MSHHHGILQAQRGVQLEVSFSLTVERGLYEKTETERVERLPRDELTRVRVAGEQLPIYSLDSRVVLGWLSNIA